ncbi:MAG: hypothetical protein ABSF48_10950, partial [Thermodesulfobacteriota bacterium]
DLPPYFWLCTWLLIHQSITQVHKGQVLFIFLQLSTIMSRKEKRPRFPAGDYPRKSRAGIKGQEIESSGMEKLGKEIIKSMTKFR